MSTMPRAAPGLCEIVAWCALAGCGGMSPPPATALDASLVTMAQRR
jgi:hypothetical protein